MIDGFDRLLPDRPERRSEGRPRPDAAPVAEPGPPPANRLAHGPAPLSRRAVFWRSVIGGYLALAAIGIVSLMLPLVSAAGIVFLFSLVIGLPAYAILGLPAFWIAIRGLAPGQSPVGACLRWGMTANLGTLPLYVLLLLPFDTPEPPIDLAMGAFLGGFLFGPVNCLAVGLVARAVMRRAPLSD